MLSKTSFQEPFSFQSPNYCVPFVKWTWNWWSYLGSELWRRSAHGRARYSIRSWSSARCWLCLGLREKLVNPKSCSPRSDTVSDGTVSSVYVQLRHSCVEGRRLCFGDEIQRSVVHVCQSEGDKWSHWCADMRVWFVVNRMETAEKVLARWRMCVCVGVGRGGGGVACMRRKNGLSSTHWLTQK